MKHSYHAHHAPMGAGGSFLLGLNGAGGGFVTGAATAGAQDVYVGYRYAGESWTLLPFLREETARAAGAAIAVLPHGRYGRTLGWASDRWMAQALVFSIATPFESLSVQPADPDTLRERLLRTPAAYALLDFDNSHMDVPVDLVFAIRDESAHWDAVAQGGGEALSGSWHARAAVGFAALGGPCVRSTQATDSLGPHVAGLVFQIPANGKAVFPIALAWGSGGAGTLRLALAQFNDARALALRRDEELRVSQLGEDGRRAVSLATRAHLAGMPGGPTAGCDLSLGAMRALAGV